MKENKMEQEIQLGDKVRCKYTGFEGIAVARTEFINGCVQFSIAPKWDGKAPVFEEMSLDSQSLEIVKRKTNLKKKKETGGKTRIGVKFRGY